MTVDRKSVVKLLAVAWGVAVAVNENRLRNQRGPDIRYPADPAPAPPAPAVEVRYTPAPTTRNTDSAAFTDGLIRQNRLNSERMIDIYTSQTPKWWL